MQTQTHSPQPTALQRFMSGFNMALPFIGIVYAVVLSIGGYWLYSRDAQTVQAQAIKDLQTAQRQIEKSLDERTIKRDAQLKEMQQLMLTRELYEAYHRADAERMDRMEKMLERILSK